jgi:hypothetical protein
MFDTGAALAPGISVGHPRAMRRLNPIATADFGRARSRRIHCVGSSRSAGVRNLTALLQRDARMPESKKPRHMVPGLSVRQA